MCEPQWAIAYSGSKYQERGRKWYRVVRVIFCDGKWWELYWHSDVTLRGDNFKKLYDQAKQSLSILPGKFTDPKLDKPHHANELVWSLHDTHWSKEFEHV